MVWGRNRLEKAYARDFTLLNNQQHKNRTERYGLDRSFTENQQQNLWYLNLQQEAYRLLIRKYWKSKESSLVTEIAWESPICGVSHQSRASRRDLDKCQSGMICVPVIPDETRQWTTGPSTPFPALYFYGAMSHTCCRTARLLHRGFQLRHGRRRTTQFIQGLEMARGLRFGTAKGTINLLTMTESLL